MRTRVIFDVLGFAMKGGGGGCGHTFEVFDCFNQASNPTETVTPSTQMLAKF